MTDKNAILEAIGKLDPTNDDHWTAGGKPAMKVIEELTGDKTIKRADVDAAAPDFTRPVEQHADEGEAGTSSNAALAVKAVAVLDVHLNALGDRFTEEDAERADLAPAEFYAEWLKRNRPSAVHRRPYHMLSDIEKARIGVFLAVARG